MTFFSYSVTGFQLLLELELMEINKFQLQLQLTHAYFPVITGLQLHLLLTRITLLQSQVQVQWNIYNVSGSLAIYGGA